MLPRGLFGECDGLLERRREEINPPHRPDPDPLPVDFGVDGDRPHLGFDECEESV